MKAAALWLSLAALMLAMPVTAATPKGAPLRAWDAKHPLPKGAKIGPFTVRSLKRVPAEGDGGETIAARFSDEMGKTFTLPADIAFEDVLATIGAGKLDPDSAKPQLLLATFTGGAHCCLHLQLADWIDGRWKRVDVGTFDGEPFSTFPTDVDGDGVADFVYYDDRFAYAFCAYACSWMPPRIFNVRKGKVADVSAAPRYRAIFLRDYERARKECADMDGPNASACAGMIADGIRLGQGKTAWKFALDHLQTEEDWTYPGCKVKADPDKGCPKGQRYQGKDFQVALTRFLADAGYVER